MLPGFAPQPSVWTVTDLSRYLKDLLESDDNLRALWVTGEVSNFKVASSGHAYFTLKDGRSQLPCVMWKTALRKQRFLPQDGDAVEVHGYVGVYEAGGRYQFYADVFKPAGEGALFRAFQRLKERLLAEGLFDDDRKRPLPRFPRRIGVVTSATGAALRDILNTLRRRYPLAEVLVSPTLVQGDGAPPAIIAALEALYPFAPDVILVARGGGSLEDLWAFNDEAVVRAVAASPVPVVSGVGHQTDFTLVDFAADRRAPTPTAAAEVTTPQREDLLRALQGLEMRLVQAVARGLQARRAALNAVEGTLQRYAPLQRVFSQGQRLDELEARLRLGVAHTIALRRARLEGVAQRLEALNPKTVLARGYALVTDARGQVVRRARDVAPDETVHIQVAEGQFDARVMPRND